MKTSALSATALLALLPLVQAKQIFVARIPNGANVPDTQALGHADGTGDSVALNDFGDAFDSAGKKWTTALCQADTDGDGQTNGQELGDPCCEWTQGGTPRWTDGVSHPGDSTKTSNASLWASITCSSTSGSGPTGTTKPSTSGNAAAPLAVGLASIAALAMASALLGFH